MEKIGKNNPRVINHLQFSYLIITAFLRKNGGNSYIIPATAMVNTTYPQTITNQPQTKSKATIFQRSQSEVVQDSIADTAMHAASPQAASEGKLSRPQTANKKEQQELLVIDGKMKTLPTTIHIDPILKHQLLELAAGQKERKLASVSAVAVALIRRGLAGDPDKPYGPSLEPVIQGSIAKGFT
ncbi:MAG TPA: hypothetical protein VE843_02775, partial [Ktedonobacteraceae bacterium]|nr:hypothetical protein [Ktedonobacteraceae bacterium]